MEPTSAMVASQATSAQQAPPSGGGSNMGASLPILGHAIDLGFNLYQSHQNKLESRRNRAFQQYNSDTAHQRAVKDLRAAGLNPILSATKGGATTPSGGQASFQSIAGGAQAGSASATLRQQSPLVQAQINATNAQAHVSDMTAKSIQQDINQKDITNPMLVKKLAEEIDSIFVHSGLAESQKNKIEQEVIAIGHKMYELNAEGQLWKKTSEILSPAGAALARDIIKASAGLISGSMIMSILKQFTKPNQSGQLGARSGKDDYNIAKEIFK